jgi:hypothetical protein
MASHPTASSRTSPAAAEDPDRIIEIAEILAAGLMRLEARKSSRKPSDFGESSLHFTPDQSGDVSPCSAEVLP